MANRTIMSNNITASYLLIKYIRVLSFPKYNETGQIIASVIFGEN